MSESTSLPETENLKTGEAAYRQLTRRAMGEVIRRLMVAESPTGLTMDDLTVESVRDRARLFAAHHAEPWARATGAIQHKPSARQAPPGAIRAEYHRLLRLLRKRLIGTLLRKERAIWKSARKQMVSRVEYAVFRVTESTVHLHCLSQNRPFSESSVLR